MSAAEEVPVPEPSASPPADRRAFVRIPSDLAASCRPTSRTHDVGWPARVRDLSRGGLALLLQHRFRPGLALAVDLRGHTGKLLRTVQVRVVHASAVFADGNHCWLLGCAFDQPLSDDELQALA